MAQTTATDKSKLPFTEQHYFSSYDHFGIHEEMLKDTTRTLSYRSAMFKNKDLFKGKIVLDVGCGTGILSMFAAKAGAKHVYSVDMSNIIDKAREIVSLNGFEDKITLLQGKLEDIELPVDTVDIIVSEWMGYFLLYESMLDTVLYARDKYLVKGGLILPDKCSMYIAGIEDAQYKDEKIHYWEDVYGFDYSPFIKVAMVEPLVDTVDNHSLITTPAKFFEFDINTVTKEELAFHSKFKLEAIDSDLCHAYIVWWDADFPGKEKVTLPTGPMSHYTHWKQTVFYMDQVLDLKKGDVIEGSIASRPNATNPRELDIEIEWDVKTTSKDKTREKKGKYNYFMR
ncbi:S-adenosyl-L-methionine-dependent methyltransferase [Scheffersomyces xylosifermentans]|uniref:S-adenosyl-L-methionine-dependent methyltransferase n=1 Tax=Scheffersomyces xylosifermentans TaxID=1304137 RepID=UPI00315CBCD1